MKRKGMLKLDFLLGVIGLISVSVLASIAALHKEDIDKLESRFDTSPVRISDQTAPTGLVKPVSVYLGTELPLPSSLVQDVYDDSGRVYISYETEPDINTAGTSEAKIRLQDRFGNNSYLTCPVTVIDDHIAPLIYGAVDLEVSYGDEEFDLMSGITVSDNYDEEPCVRCDTSALDLYEPGVYAIKYFASDDAGNCRIKTVNVTVKDPEDGDMDAYLKQMVNDIYKEIKCRYPIWTARAILNYVHDNMTYDPASCGTSDINEAAYYGFANHKGNCYVYYCMCKVLLDRAGIQNMPIVRYPANPTGHYWILIRYRGYWWHCDATPFKGHEGVYFMLNDNQLDQYHQFDHSAYPARSPSGSHLAIGAVYGQSGQTNVPAADPSSGQVPEDNLPEADEPVITPETDEDLPEDIEAPSSDPDEGDPAQPEPAQPDPEEPADTSSEGGEDEL